MLDQVLIRVNFVCGGIHIHTGLFTGVLAAVTGIDIYPILFFVAVVGSETTTTSTTTTSAASEWGEQHVCYRTEETSLMMMLIPWCCSFGCTRSR